MLDFASESQIVMISNPPSREYIVKERHVIGPMFSVPRLNGCNRVFLGDGPTGSQLIYLYSSQAFYSVPCRNLLDFDVAIR